MRWMRRLHALPLRTKVWVTFGAVVALALALSSVLSFRYWQREFIAASQQQAALAAQSTRAALETTLPGGHLDAGRRSLAQVVGGSPVTAARVYGRGGTILLSSAASEEGPRPTGVWIPAAPDLPREGVVNQGSRGDTLRTFLPLSLSGDGDAVLELELPVAETRAAMERGALLGHGLMLAAFVALGVILVAMLEREVVTPLQRMESELAGQTGDRSAAAGEVDRVRHSVQRLLEREREVEAHAEATDRTLREREGLAEVGQLAAEMAHEFKRPLAAIRVAMEMLEQEYALDQGGRAVLGKVDGQLDRLSETMQDLFALARPVAVEMEPVSLVAVADDALLEIRSLPGADRIDVERDMDPTTPDLPGDPRRLVQALSNLMANALEAMPHGGTLSVSVRSVAPDRVAVTVADTGSGIPEAEIERAIRPFYSTKPLGTGLGLPLVARVVAAHGGELEIHSVEGEGTRVTITLDGSPPATNPAAVGGAADAEPIGVDAGALEARPRGGGR